MAEIIRLPIYSTPIKTEEITRQIKAKKLDDGKVYVYKMDKDLNLILESST